MPDRGAEQPPEGVATEPDRDEREQELAERLVRDRVQCALLVRDLASVPERQPERENADDSVDEPPRDEACAGERFERMGALDTLANAPGGTNCATRPCMH